MHSRWSIQLTDTLRWACVESVNTAPAQYQYTFLFRSSSFWGARAITQNPGNSSEDGKSYWDSPLVVVGTPRARLFLRLFLELDCYLGNRCAVSMPYTPIERWVFALAVSQALNTSGIVALCIIVLTATRWTHPNNASYCSSNSCFRFVVLKCA